MLLRVRFQPYYTRLISRLLLTQCSVCATAMSFYFQGVCKHYLWGNAVIHMPCHLGCLLQHVVHTAASVHYNDLFTGHASACSLVRLRSFLDSQANAAR